MPMFDREEYFRCWCHSAEHALHFDLDKDGEHEDSIPELFTEVYLNQYRPWWKRVWVAVKYVFGYRCKDGHYDCWTLRHEDADRLRSLLDEYLEACEKSKHFPSKK